MPSETAKPGGKRNIVEKNKRQFDERDRTEYRSWREEQEKEQLESVHIDEPVEAGAELPSKTETGASFIKKYDRGANE